MLVSKSSGYVTNKRRNRTFEVLATLTVKRTVFWLVTLCSMEKAQWFDGTYYLPHQSQRVSQVRNQQEASSKQCRVFHLLLVWLTLGP
jgi:hypothetical protein